MVARDISFVILIMLSFTLNLSFFSLFYPNTKLINVHNDIYTVINQVSLIHTKRLNFYATLLNKTQKFSSLSFIGYFIFWTE